MKLHHLAILTEDLESSLAFWRDALGLHLKDRKSVISEGVEVAFLGVGESFIELVKPATAESSLTSQLKKPGTKLHHVCIEVDDIDSCLCRLKKEKINIISDRLKKHEDGRRYFFIHPSSTGGVLVEIYEKVNLVNG